MAVSRPSTPTLSADQHSTPEYRNWLALGHALTTVLCQGLRPFINREVETFYTNVSTALSSAGPCTCVFVAGRRPNQYHDMSKCAWANLLQGHHHKNRPNWKQSDATKWTDPVLGPWEMAKLFLPDLGGHVVQSADDMDITGILNLMDWCDHFRPIPRTLIEDVRDIRNHKWVHVPKLELAEADKAIAFAVIESLLQVPYLTHDQEAQKALREIQTLKCVSDLNNFQAQVLNQYKEIIDQKILELQRELEKESNLRNQLEGRLHNIQELLQNLKNMTKAIGTFPNLFKSGSLFLCNKLINSTRAMLKPLLTPWLMILLLFSCITVLDPRSYKDGCPSETSKVPFDTKDINMSEYLKTARAENFFGRHWLYKEVEDLFEDNNVAGVMVIGNPGTGKSAWSSQLICSRTTSSTIHTQIVGYHFCKYSDKNTQMAGKFVRNLAEMIARRLPEYGYVVSSSSYIQRSFDQDCVQNEDPVSCFEQTIITPLRNLKNEPIHNWFIIVDALDECRPPSETGHSIINLLENKINRFPKWLKLIMTSRNESDTTLLSSKIKKVILNPEDSRNLEDIEIFVMTRLYEPSPLLYRITSWFGDDSVESTTKLAATLLSKSQGNFLFVKELLNHWEHSRHELRNAYALPKSLEDLYHSYFERLYPRKRNFRYVRLVLESLVSTFEPLTQKEIFEVLRMRENTLDEEYGQYDFKDRLKELGHFLKYGENNTITLYHLSLADWLTSENNEKFFVSKRKGHETLSGYYIRLIKEGDKSTLLKYILTLAQHIAFGGWKEAYIKEFLNFPSQTVNSSDPLSNRTLLHFAATINSTDVLNLLLRHFSSIDGVDNRGITPAFLAAEQGLVDNLAVLVKKGADVNKKAMSIIVFYKNKIRTAFEEFKFDDGQSYAPPKDIPVQQTKSTFFDSSMLHLAAQGGHVNVVRFLLANNAEVSALNGVNMTAIQLAAENGHLEVVKDLHEAGATADQTALYLAAVNNRFQVVDFLLSVGVKDECLRCDGSFYWLEQMVEDSGQFYDDKHLILCHSALHAAVASGHDKVVSRLIAEEQNALNCYDYSGRSPLHEAIRKNRVKIVDALLERHPQMVHYKCEHWQEVDSSELSFEELTEYNADVCHCGYTPLHLAARYGHQELAVSLIRKGARLDDRDCSGATPIHVAACHNQGGLILIFSHPNVGGDINAKTLNGSTPLHSAAACGATEVIDYLLYNKADLTAVDNYDLTILHYSILNIKTREVYQKVCPNDSPFCESVTPVVIDTGSNRRGHLSGFFSDKKEIKSTDRLHWLDTLLKLALRRSNINAVDTKGQTALHVAAQNGLADAVNVLLQFNASAEKEDIHGKTPLQVAVEYALIVPIHLSFHLEPNKIEYLGFGKVLSDHEMVVFLLLYYGSSFGKCKKEGNLLHKAILNKQPYIIQLLLLKGASLRCKDNFGRTPLLAYLQNGAGEFIDGVLATFSKTVPIECGRPFNLSLYHLLSYHYPTHEHYNFFYLKQCSGPDYLACQVNKGPLAEALESHPRKQSIFRFCFDAEGFTPLHRAAQGGNLVAIRYLLANGASDFVLSANGHDALTMAVLFAGKRRLLEFEGLMKADKNILKMAQSGEEGSIELLRHAMKSRGYQIRCDSRKSELTLYHLAAFFNLAEFIEVLLEESDLLSLNVSCANADGITPMYLAKLFENNDPRYRYNGYLWKQSRKQVIEIIKGHGGEIRYPKRDAEYDLIYRRLYGQFTLDLRPEQFRFIMSLITSYKKNENSSFLCSSDLSYHFQDKRTLNSLLSMVWSSIALENAILRLPYQRMSRFQRRMKLCYREQTLTVQYLNKLTKISPISMFETTLEVQQKQLQVKLLTLMKMRHVHSKYFTCIKSLYYKLKPFLSAEAALKSHPLQYEKTIPYFYLSSICEDINSILRRKRMSSDFPLFNWHTESWLYDRSDFANERLNILAGRSPKTVRVNHFHHSSEQWPLEYLVKRFHGVLSQYDYLKTLQLELDPGINVPLT